MSLQDAGRVAAESVGILWRDVPTDGGWHETPVEGKGRHNGSGRIRCFTDGEGGQVWNWISGECVTFWAKADAVLTSEEREARRKRAEEARAEAEAEQQRRAEEAAQKAATLWTSATDGPSPYTDRKVGTIPTPTLRTIDAREAARILGYTPKNAGIELAGQLLVVPIKTGNRTTSIQLIDGDGRKHFIAGGQLKGGFWATGRLPSSDGDGATILIGEGVATMLSCHLSTGHIGVAAMSCGNLPAVATEMQRRYPKATIIVCSDRGNGEADARRAATEVGGRLAVPEFPEDFPGSDFNDLAASFGIETVRQQLDQATTAAIPEQINFDQDGDQPAKRPSIIFSDVAEELLHPVVPSWLIENRLEDHTTAALIGESTAGKSFTAVALSYSCATGAPFAGSQVMRTGPVIYFAPEGRQAIPRRLLACQDHHGVTIPKGRLFLPRGRIEFNLDGARLIAEAMTELVEQHGPPVLLVIDTLARSLPAGADENSSRDMMDFINAVELLRDRFGCVVLIVHHSGHAADAQGRARGSSAFRAALDTEILVDRRKKHLRWTKMKDAEIPAPIPFELVQVGPSAVAVYGEPQQARGPELTKAEAFAVATLQETLDRLKRPWATVDEWRQDYYRRHTGDTTAAKRQAFHRARLDLVSKGALRVDNDAYALNVTSVTERDKSQAVTGEDDRDNRDTHPLGCVTLSRLTVTPPELIDVDLPDQGELL